MLLRPCLRAGELQDRRHANPWAPHHEVEDLERLAARARAKPAAGERDRERPVLAHLEHHAHGPALIGHHGPRHDLVMAFGRRRGRALTRLGVALRVDPAALLRSYRGKSGGGLEEWAAVTFNLRGGVDGCYIARMAVRLDIRGDGDGPGLREHRLSIATFGKALMALHQSLRAIASKIDTGQDPASADPKSGGVPSRTAKLIDVQLLGLSDGCVQQHMEVILVDTHHADPSSATESLLEQTVETFVRHVAEHVRGTVRRPSVASYVEEIRAHVTDHEYRALRSDGTVLVETMRLGVADVEQEPQEVPLLMSLRGSVVGVVFAEGKQSVSVMDEHGSLGVVKCRATPVQVEKAVDLHRTGAAVEARFIRDGRMNRLLSVRDATEARRKWTEEEISDDLHDRWGHLLQRLAE